MGLDKWLYNLARRKTVEYLRFDGETRTIGGSSVLVMQKESHGYVTMASGTTVPTAAGAGYAKGCIFIKTDAAAGASGLYTNVGTATACVFVKNSPVTFVPATATVAAWGATDTTIAAAEIADLNNTNTGAGNTISLTLPAASTMTGRAFRVQLTVAQIVQLLPQTGEKIYLGGSGVASKYLNIAAVIGNYCDVYCDGTDYHVVGYSGVVTKEG